MLKVEQIVEYRKQGNSPMGELRIPRRSATILQAEGARIGLIVCPKCGAAILVDPRDDVDLGKLHEEWHEALEEQPE